MALIRSIVKNLMEKPTTTSLCFLLLTGMIFSAGCDNKFWDPMQVGRFRPVPSVNVILDSLGVAEETESVWEGAEEPRPADLMVYETDYTFGSGDVVRITIFELHQEGGLFANEYVVTETGKISIPEVGIIETGGLTEAQLEEEIKQILDPGILKDPLVSVTLISSQQRTFSILGDGVPGPSRYSIPRYDFRLTDALAQAGGIRQFNVSYIYVSRSISSNESAVEPIALQTRELERIKPQAEYAWSENNLLITSSEMITDADLTNAATPEGFELPAVQQRQTIEPEKTPLSEPKTGVRETIAPATQPQQAGQIEWVFKDGKWVPTQAGQPVSKPEPRKIARVPEKTLDEELAWDELGTSAPQSRVIEIPADKLRGGDPKYNIIIRPGDSIHVPVDIIGEFCIMGNTNSQGFIELTGRPMTLKMAIAAAGGLGPLAWPKNCEVVRRIGKKKEEIVMVDLDKIASGEQPDFFIKPNDLINIGTHITSRWRAVLRNAFRATYGFGFLYDRNFADRDFGTRRPIPNIF